MARPFPTRPLLTLLRFGATFIVVTLAFSVFWMPILPVPWLRWDLASAYNALLVEGMNWIYPITSGGLIFAAKGKYIVLLTDSLAPSEQRQTLLDGYSLAMNVVPLTGLFWSTPGLGIRRRILFYLVSLAILYCTQIVHIYLDLLLLMPPVILPFGYKIVIYLKIVFYSILWVFTIFWEQAGRMFFPFILWLIFGYRYFPEVGLGLFRPKPRPRAEGAGREGP